MDSPKAEPYKIKMVTPIYKSTRIQREIWLKEAKYNLFNLKSKEVYIDLLSDSGTGAMSEKQWAARMLGDESYAGASSYFELKNVIKNIFGFDYVLPTHQGRGAENVLFSNLVQAGDIVPGNSYFDTTKCHIQMRKGEPIDCTLDEAFDTESLCKFKGNLDLNKLNTVVSKDSAKIKMIVLTITNNTIGGQPVSMQNIKNVSEFTKRNNLILVVDAARFAENAYFIKTREVGYEELCIHDIVKEMFFHFDIMIMSGKKDAMVNIGGFIALREKRLYDQIKDTNIIYEGFLTYGGMSGRDMCAMAQGLRESLEFDTLRSRISQVEYLGRQLIKNGIPVQQPIGGHAVYIDATKFFPNVRRKEFPAQTLALELYLEGGIRGVEIGGIFHGVESSKLELVRLAIPRRTYTNNHMDVVVHAAKRIWERRHKVCKGVQIVSQAASMRHFTIELEYYT